MINWVVAIHLAIVTGLVVLVPALLAPQGYGLFVGAVLWEVLYSLAGVAIVLGDRLQAIEEALRQTR
jgi:hypothetical protein